MIFYLFSLAQLENFHFQKINNYNKQVLFADGRTIHSFTNSFVLQEQPAAARTLRLDRTYDSQKAGFCDCCGQAL